MIEWSLRNLSIQKIESLIEQKLEKDAITRSLDLRAEDIYLNFCKAERVKLAAGTELCVHSSLASRNRLPAPCFLFAIS